MSESSKCGACGKPSESPICWSDAKRLRARLISDPGMPWLIARVAESAYGGATLGRGKQRRGNGAPPMPLDIRAADLLREIITSLRRWSFRLGGVEARDASVEVLPHFIARHIGEVMMWGDAAAVLQTVEAHTFRAFRAVNRPPEVFLGPCDNTLESGESCGSELWADADAEWVGCGRCKHLHSVDTIRAGVWERAGCEPLPATVIAQVLKLVGIEHDDADLTRALGFAWPATYLHPDGQRRQTDDAGAVPLYRLAEVVDLLNDAAESRTHRTRRRRRSSDQTSRTSKERTSA